MISRSIIKLKLLESIQEQLDVLSNQIRELTLDAQNDAKSSAGDKHETALSMMHLEQEKLNVKFAQLLDTKQKVLTLPTEKMINKVVEGSLVITKNVILYVSVAWPAIKCENKSILCLSKDAPLMQVLQNQIVGSKVLFNSNTFEIIDIL